MFHPQRTRPQKHSPTIPAYRTTVTHAAATIPPTVVVPATVRRKLPSHATNVHRPGTVPVVLTVIPTPAVLRNPTVISPAPRPVAVAPRRPAVVAPPVKPRRRPVRAPVIPGMPLARGQGGHFRRVPVRRR